VAAGGQTTATVAAPTTPRRYDTDVRTSFLVDKNVLMQFFINFYFRR